LLRGAPSVPELTAGPGFEITEGPSSNMIRGNVANRNTFEGFKIFMANSNTLTGNTGNSNGSFGFLVFAGSSFNTLTGNVGRANGLFDAYDEGSGTGNVWASNNFGTTFGI
jgi:parallel beta-helix repeat protein